MKLSARLVKRKMKFEFLARTSRGALREKDSYFLLIENEKGEVGIGEASPLRGLSIDDREDFLPALEAVVRELSDSEVEDPANNLSQYLDRLIPSKYPSIRFAVETALLDLSNGGMGTIYQGDFSEGRKGIPINGLIWMGDLEFMLTQITQKVYDGFRCLKIKIGSLDFERECDILDYIRRKYYKDQIEIRVDANGAFKPENALERLDKLYEYDLHSIEQPVKPGQRDLMRSLCKQTPFPIALDEELIGISEPRKMKEMLEYVRPHYIVIKPMLVGGFSKAEQWRSVAESLDIRWWITSALESSIGLNAIAQYTDNLNVTIPQGLGTGQIYSNNILSPLEIRKAEIWFNKTKKWDLNSLMSDQ